MPVLEDVRRDLDPVALRALDRIAAAVDLRLDVLDLDAGRGLLGRWEGTVRRLSARRESVNRMELPRSSGIVLHPTSLPGGTLGAEAYAFVDWLAAAGQSWWQVLPLGPPDEARLAVRLVVRVRGLERPARRAGRAGLDAASRRVPPRERLLGEDWERAGGSARRPGAVRAGVVGAARLRRERGVG